MLQADALASLSAYSTNEPYLSWIYFHRLIFVYHIHPLFYYFRKCCLSLSRTASVLRQNLNVAQYFASKQKAQNINKQSARGGINMFCFVFIRVKLKPCFLFFSSLEKLGGLTLRRVKPGTRKLFILKVVFVYFLRKNATGLF